MLNILSVAIGGALGSVLRYLSFEVVTKMLRHTSYVVFPFSTLFVNVAGSALAGALYYFMIKDVNFFHHQMKNLLLVGFLGGFTTFSAFSLDFFRLFIAGHEFLAVAYALTSVSLAILFLFFGFYLMKIIFV